MGTRSVKEVVSYCQEIFEDLEFRKARERKSAQAGRKVIGFMPVYVPRGIIHAAGMLSLGIWSGGAELRDRMALGENQADILGDRPGRDW